MKEGAGGGTPVAFPPSSFDQSKVRIGSCTGPTHLK